MACILSERVDETTAKVISITENLVRVNPKSRLYRHLTALSRKYGSIKSVAEETGLPYHKVQHYVKYDRLKPELKKMVDEGDVELKVALKAQDAASVTGSFNPEEAVKFAKELSQMSGAQQTRVVKQRRRTG